MWNIMMEAGGEDVKMTSTDYPKLAMADPMLRKVLSRKKPACLEVGSSLAAQSGPSSTLAWPTNGDAF